ncbi:hypothetical protein [Paenibacillus harenae]|uniref:Uncharacterized protein n=1 Tax=Paenibacillus harenae TaxID=306543 RepID=A0ABT9TYH7_PAEHA|nr:hypothetical protein [Paenibacillus harenae]MDQ0112429.1 hypothetical protein [Paenibacillus harenae]
MELGKSKDLGKHLYYYSEKFGILSSFPWWDHVDKMILEDIESAIPMGTINNPFVDVEQGWSIVIIRKREFVYLMQSNDPAANNFNRWYKVLLENYLDQWNRLIDYLKNDFAG